MEQEKELQANDQRVVEARAQLGSVKVEHEKVSSHLFAARAELETAKVCQAGVGSGRIGSIASSRVEPCCSFACRTI
jgi:hypothetical protein